MNVIQKQKIRIQLQHSDEHRTFEFMAIKYNNQVCLQVCKLWIVGVFRIYSSSFHSDIYVLIELVRSLPYSIIHPSSSKCLLKHSFAEFSAFISNIYKNDGDKNHLICNIFSWNIWWWKIHRHSAPRFVPRIHNQPPNEDYETHVWCSYTGALALAITLSWNLVSF